MAEYTSLTSEELSALIGRFGLPEFVSCEPLKGGRANSSFLVDSGTERFVLTVCDAKTAEETQRAVRLLELMGNAGLRVPRPGRPTDGSGLVTHQGRPVLLKSYFAGVVQRELSHSHLSEVGASLARLHQIPPPADLDSRFSYGLEFFEEVVGWSRSGGFGEWLKLKREHLQPWSQLELPRGLIHGDLFWDNIVVSDDSVALLDFEEACHYRLVFDLGMAMVGCCFRQDQPWLPRARSLVQGYQQIRALESVECRALQDSAVYAAAATGCWRFWQYHIFAPDPAEANAHLEMQAVADAIQALPEEQFGDTVLV